MKISKNLWLWMIALVNAIAWSYVSTQCTSSSQTYCDGSNFDPPDLFQLFEGPTAVYQRGYVRGMYTTSSIINRPSHCSSSVSANQQFAHLSTKMQQIGITTDTTNNDDWFYFEFGNNDANRYKMQQTFIQGSFEGCINQIYWYYSSSNQWRFYRRLFTIDTVIDSTTGASATTFNKKAESDVVYNTDQTLIP